MRSDDRVRLLHGVEAANPVAYEGRALLPGLPWPAIVGMRHRVVHAYFQIDAETVWKTAPEERPTLRSIVHAALDAD